MSPLDSLGPNFVPTLVSLSAQAHVDPLGAAAVLLYESGLQSSIINSIGAVGINQIVPQNYSVFAPLTVDQYRSLTAVGQLPYVFKFWRGVLRDFGRGQSFYEGRDLYWLNILPGTFIPNVPDNYRIPFTATQYKANQNLDFNHKGFITPGDFITALTVGAKKNPALWNALVQAIGIREQQAVASAAGLVAFVGGVGLLAGAAAFLVATE